MCSGKSMVAMLYLNRENVLLVMPPTPYPCPIGGRYSFEQFGLEEEKYYTRVRGITERPRHNIDCQEYTSEIRSCPDNPTKMKIDVEYCATLDHTGKPIGEYGEFTIN